MSKRALLLEAHHTTHIEGTRLTLAEAEQLLAGHDVPQASVSDVENCLTIGRRLTSYLIILIRKVPLPRDSFVKSTNVWWQRAR